MSKSNIYIAATFTTNAAFPFHFHETTLVQLRQSLTHPENVTQQTTGLVYVL